MKFFTASIKGLTIAVIAGLLSYLAFFHDESLDSKNIPGSIQPSSRIRGSDQSSHTMEARAKKNRSLAELRRELYPW